MIDDDVRVEINEARLSTVLRSPTGPVGRILRTSGLRVERAAKRLAPVDFGHLRRSIKSSSVLYDLEGPFVEVGSRLPYARRVEMGFVGKDRLGRRYNQAPQPYLRTALSAINTGEFRMTSEQYQQLVSGLVRRRTRIARQKSVPGRRARAQRRANALYGPRNRGSR